MAVLSSSCIPGPSEFEADLHAGRKEDSQLKPLAHFMARFKARALGLKSRNESSPVDWQHSHSATQSLNKE